MKPRRLQRATISSSVTSEAGSVAGSAVGSAIVRAVFRVGATATGRPRRPLRRQREGEDLVVAVGDLDLEALAAAIGRPQRAVVQPDVGGVTCRRRVHYDLVAPA